MHPTGQPIATRNCRLNFLDQMLIRLLITERRKGLDNPLRRCRALCWIACHQAIDGHFQLRGTRWPPRESDVRFHKTRIRSFVSLDSDPSGR